MKAMLKNIVGAVAPTLGSALAGPLGGQAASVIAGVLGCGTKPKEIEINCYVNEIYQNKSTVVVGDLEYTNFKNNQVKFTDPIRYEMSFEHKSANCVGDRRALNKETKSMCDVQPLPFPNDKAMIMMTVKGLKDLMKNIIIKRDGNLK